MKLRPSFSCLKLQAKDAAWLVTVRQVRDDASSAWSWDKSNNEAVNRRCWLVASDVVKFLSLQQWLLVYHHTTCILTLIHSVDVVHSKRHCFINYTTTPSNNAIKTPILIICMLWCQPQKISIPCWRINNTFFINIITGIITIFCPNKLTTVPYCSRRHCTNSPCDLLFCQRSYTVCNQHLCVWIFMIFISLLFQHVIFSEQPQFTDPSGTINLIMTTAISLSQFYHRCYHQPWLFTVIHN